MKKSIKAFMCLLAAAIMTTSVPSGLTAEYSFIQKVYADTDDDVLWYDMDGGWAGFDPVKGVLTWWPQEVSGDIEIPDSFDGVPVTSIGEWAFYKHDGITAVTLPDTVTMIDEGAFWGCTALTTVNGFGNVRAISNSVFKDCENLKKIDSFKSLRSIGTGAFEGCSVMTELVIPASSYNEPAITTNVSKQIYSDSVTGRTDSDYCSQKVSSYLYWDGKNYWRVEAAGVVSVEKYTKDFDFVEGFNLKTDLMKPWGGFYCGKKFNFIVTGGYNYEEDNKKMVITVDKYSKNWKKLKSLTISNFNTVEFPRSSALRFSETGNILYIHTAHRMYQAKDGYNHQTSISLQINEKNMKLMSSSNSMNGWFSGAVSHSFNQYILIDSDKNIITLDHGDASPRSICLYKLGVKAGKKNPFSAKGTRVELYKIPEYTGDEEWGYNMTGTSVGGLEETKTGYITAYATDGKGGNADYSGIKNIYLTYTPKKDFTEKATVTKKITSYQGGGNTGAGTPQTVSMGVDGGYIIWDIIKNGKVSGKISYVKYDSAGKISKVKTADAFLSDCKPIAVNGEALWYVTQDSVPVVYHLTENGVTMECVNGDGSN